MTKKSCRFFDGPPFANGDPHYGHLACSVLKDIYGRFYNIDVSQWVWDCHGLPVEMMVEKKYVLDPKKNKEEFINKCKEEVLKTQSTWDYYINQVGRKVDFNRSLKTMDKKYETKVIEIFNKLYRKGLIYRDYKVMPYSYKCKTCLSKLEISADNSYQKISSNSAYVKVKVEDEEIEVWTTTIWTLPFNQAIAVNPNGKYKHLIGKTYKQIISGYNKNQKEYKIISADFVNDSEGSGAVHIATSFGEDDFKLGKQYGLKPLDVLDDECKFKTGFLKGLLCVSKEAEDKVLDELKGRVRLEKITHEYPMCPRTNTKLVYRAMDSWFLDVQQLKSKMLNKLDEINFYPYALKKAFEDVIKTAPDWCISRNRVFGVPLPVDKSLVLDCWFESACVPYVVNCELPSKFVCEYTAQIKGWFYNLLVISTALDDKTPFENMIGHGTILGNDGKKMSKHLHNFPDPKPMIEDSDAFRWSIASSNLCLGEAIRISESFNRDSTIFLNRLKNCKKLYETYLEIDSEELAKYIVKYVVNNRTKGTKCVTKFDSLDTYILCRFFRTLDEGKKAMSSFNTKRFCKLYIDFVDDLSNWYLRNKKKLLWDSVNKSNVLSKIALYTVLNTIFKGLYEDLKSLRCILLNLEPLKDFSKFNETFSELSINQVILNDSSEVTTSFSNFSTEQIQLLEANVAEVKDLCNKIHNIRKSEDIPVKKPLSILYLRLDLIFDRRLDKQIKKELECLIKQECNILRIKKPNFFHKEYSFLIKKRDLSLFYKRELVHYINTKRKELDYPIGEYVVMKIPYTKEYYEAFKKFKKQILKECCLIRLDFDV